MPHQKLLDIFEKHRMVYELHKHSPLFTIEDSCELHDQIEGAHSKNLFIRDKRKNYFLVSVLENKRVDLKALSKNHGAGHFSFGNSEELMEMLGVVPGSVTPYGLINDTNQKVSFLLDQDFLNSKTVNFHPLRNDMTVNAPLDHFLSFFDKIGKAPQIIEVPCI